MNEIIFQTSSHVYNVNKFNYSQMEYIYIKFQQCQLLSPGYMVKFVNSIEKLNVNLISQASRPITSNGTHAGFNSA